MTAAPRRLVDISTVAAMLADRADALCGELLPAGTREGHEWRVGSVAGEPGRSMAVHLYGGKAEVWCDWAADLGGDALDLVAQVLFRGDKSQAFRWARAWLGLDNADPASFEQHRREAAKRREQTSDDEDRRQRQAAKIFLSALPHLAGTPAAVYLDTRAIDLAQLGRQPRALRFHPYLWNEETQRHWPALVAAIVDADGRMVAVHRTWLTPEGGKAPLRDPKMTLGRYAGGCIRLWRGASGKPLKDAPAGDMLVISEGIEDALSVAVAAPEYRVIAAVSLGNMANITLPTAIGTIIIAAQNDAPGSSAARALDRVIAKFLAEGRRVKIARPPPDIKDLNDLLQASRGAA
jgi:phage/plasmid primase-like uncharacterized protein